MSSYQPSFSLQGSQPYSLTHDFMNNRWTPDGTYWEPRPTFLFRTDSNVHILENNVENNNEKEVKTPKKKYLYYTNK